MELKEDANLDLTVLCERARIHYMELKEALDESVLTAGAPNGIHYMELKVRVTLHSSGGLRSSRNPLHGVERGLGVGIPYTTIL